MLIELKSARIEEDSSQTLYSTTDPLRINFTVSVVDLLQISLDIQSVFILE